MGKLRFLHTRTQKNEQKGCGIEAERTRLRDAIAFVLQNLAELQERAHEQVGADAAEIFSIHA
ncbi:MAG: hypothetical protein J6V22_01865, partial [Clostridia bacterium]|nr:hypothetical protein [Clostridia bacterium]